MAGQRDHRQRQSAVFIGPTLARAEAEARFDAIYLPPAAQGSLVAVVQRHNPRNILIVDGVFQTEPAVRHKEILWAVSIGIPVLGAASMGALRAAELYPYMTGVGLIYRWYRRFQFAPDDAVAVMHGPSELNDAALTVAEVDWRMTFRSLALAREISGDERRTFCECVRSMNFRGRSLDRVARASARATGRRSEADWKDLLQTGLVEQKKLDALQAIEMLRRGVAGPQPPTVDFQPTAAFTEDLRQSRFAR